MTLGFPLRFQFNVIEKVEIHQAIISNNQVSIWEPAK